MFFVDQGLHGLVVNVNTIDTRHELALLTGASRGVKGSKIQRSAPFLGKVFGLGAVVITAKTRIVQVESVTLVFHEVKVAGQRE